MFDESFFDWWPTRTTVTAPLLIHFMCFPWYKDNNRCNNTLPKLLKIRHRALKYILDVEAHSFAVTLMAYYFQRLVFPLPRLLLYMFLVVYNPPLCSFPSSKLLNVGPQFSSKQLRMFSCLYRKSKLLPFHAVRKFLDKHSTHVFVTCLILQSRIVS